MSVNLNVENRIGSLFRELKCKLNEFAQKKSEFNLIQAEHFFSLRNSVDIKRETLIHLKIFNFKNNSTHVEKEVFIEKLNKQSKKIINEIDLAEKKFRQNFDDQIEFVQHVNRLDHVLKLFEYDLYGMRYESEEDKDLGRVVIRRKNLLLNIQNTLYPIHNLIGI